MPIGTLIAFYFMLWWISWLIVLPFGNQKPDSKDERAQGTDTGAPKRFLAWPKILSATILAAILLAVLSWALSSQWIIDYWK